MSELKKKKQSSKNAFEYFCSYFQLEEEKNGMVFQDGTKEVKERAAVIWHDMNHSERWVYEEEARKEKERNKTDWENKFTAHGKSYAQVVREKNEAMEQEESMMKDIERTVRNLDQDSSLKTYTFHMIHVNYYCRLDTGTYIPCEIALAEFNLVDGVTKTYHTLINPCGIRLGYTYQAAKYSAETHHIPLPSPKLPGEADHTKILKKIKEFMGVDTEQVPPFYSVPHSIEPVKNVLWKLQKCVDDDLEPDSDIFRVYPIPKLLFELRNASNASEDASGFQSLTSAELVFDKDELNLTKGISCDFHEDTDAYPFCSLSCVRRWSYVILRHCCEGLDIAMVPGRHCPNRISTFDQPGAETKYVSLSSSDASCNTSNGFRDSPVCDSQLGRRVSPNKITEMRNYLQSDTKIQSGPSLKNMYAEAVKQPNDVPEPHNGRVEQLHIGPLKPEQREVQILQPLRLPRTMPVALESARLVPLRRPQSKSLALSLLS